MEAKELRLLPFDLEKAKAGAKVVTRDGRMERLAALRKEARNDR